MATRSIWTRRVVYPVLILAIAGWIIHDQREATAASQARAEQAVNGLISAAANGTLPTTLPLSDPSMDDVIRRELALVAAPGAHLVETLNTSRDGAVRRHEIRLAPVEPHPGGFTLIVEATPNAIMIVGYRLPDPTDLSVPLTE